MNSLTEKILEANWNERVFTEGQLARLLDGTPQRRYNLVNRALHDGELLRLRRGRYLLASALAQRKLHPFVLAQALRPGSYVSFETALSFHGWIPEATPPILCVAPGRRRLERIDPRFGEFRFYPLALTTGYFLRDVERHMLGNQTALVAQPLRALLDRFCLRKQAYPGLDALVHDLRIDADLLAGIRDEDLQDLRPVYQHRRMAAFIDALQRDLRA